MDCAHNVHAVTVATKAFQDQKPGTSGLRKPVATYMQEHYTENFVQCILDAGLGDRKRGAKLVVGGDGRYLSDEVLQKIFRIAAANGVAHIRIGKNGLMSTPSVSLAIREFKADGGIILTASHNPGGLKGDFGIKFNVSNGGPALESVTDKIYQLSTRITEYSICPDLKINYDSIGRQEVKVDNVGAMTIEVFDTVSQYADRMEQMFDFGLLKSLVSGKLTGKPFRVLIDSLHGVTGPYVVAIFHERLGAPMENLRHYNPLPDFGGHHPDPNLTYAAGLVTEMQKGAHDFGAAFDGDGDRNMIIGEKGFFVTPSDSLAILARHADSFPYFKHTGGVKGYARSMPTAAAVDRVAKQFNRECFEVPTGWKFFGNLMDAGRLSICGEESFGTGCDYIREKDGIWSSLAWLTVLATCKMSVGDIVRAHWSTYGRNVFTRYDYENCDGASCKAMMEKLEKTISDGQFIGKSFSNHGRTFTVSKADSFAYTDPIDHSLSKNQGLRIYFADNSRLVYRISGTGSTGATVRIYVDGFEENVERQKMPAGELLKPLIDLALELCEIKKYTGRDKPTVIT
uniref:phosphoglucomutase (alpha-D-glucose-1,6-bisphosphate-dependent) n=1 Tax=Trichuris muris TaxID=70415 RepID=A0A5S6R4I1_TRIMR